MLQIKKSGHLRSLARKLGWTLFAQVFGRMAGFLAAIGLARVLPIEGFGAYALLQSTLLMLQAVAMFGLGTTSTKYVAELRYRDRERTAQIIMFCLTVGTVVGICLGAGLFIFADDLSRIVLGGSELLRIPMRITALAVPIMTLTAIGQGVIAGFESFHQLARTSTAAGVMSLLLLPLGGYLGGLEGASTAFLAVQIVALAYTLRMLAKICVVAKVRLSEGAKPTYWRAGKLFWRFSAPTALLTFIVWPTQWLGNAILAHQGAAELAVYSAAMQITNSLLMLSEALGQVVLPLFASAAGKGVEAEPLLAKITYASLAVTVPLVLILVVEAEPLMGLFGKKYVGGTTTLVSLLLTVVVVATQTPVGKYLQAKGAAVALALASLIWAIIYVAPLWYFANIGAPTLAAARLLAFSVNTLVLAGMLQVYRRADH
jgi:O-antigen/teichoic acid export membrane protein